jgi:cell shape-determining protein MreC
VRWPLIANLVVGVSNQCLLGVSDVQDEAKQLEDLAQQNERLSADVEQLQQVKAQVGGVHAGGAPAALCPG